MQIGALMSRPEGRREVHRFLKFATVGALGAVIDYGLLNLLILGAGMPKFWANCCSFTAAVLSNFVWNRLWTFPESRERPVGSQLLQFAIINIIGLAINQSIFLSVDRFVLGEAGGWYHVSGEIAAFLGISAPVVAYNLSKACATVVALFWNFGGNRLVTYRGL